MSERYWDVWDEERSKKYIKNYGLPDKPNKQHLRRMNIAKSLLEGDSVLDVACGIGHLYHVLPKTIKYVGVDTSSHMLSVARRYADAEFLIGDAYNLEGLSIYDSVIAQSILIHLPDIEKPINEMWKHTRKALIFSIPISNKSVITLSAKYKDKTLLSHAETWENIENIVKSLPEYLKMTHIVEPELKLNNVYFKVWRR